MPQLIANPEFAHWMLREIFEQPAALAATMAHAIGNEGFKAEVCDPIREWVNNAHGEIVIAASGSSRHAGMVAELLLENRTGIAVDVEYASEYSYRSKASLKDASLLVISQSGETVDTLAALRNANDAGYGTLAITNNPSSTMATEATVSFPTLAGRERAIPATKSFTTQLLNLNLLSLIAAQARGTLSEQALETALQQLAALPATIERQLDGWRVAVEQVATHYASAKTFLFLGRGMHYPIAREGALKLKESSYVHAEAYPSGELKHGPNALVDDDTPLVMIATCDHAEAESVERYERVVALMRDMKQQGARILALANVGDDTVSDLANDTLYVEETSEALLTICEVIPLQLFSYFMALQNGIDVDNPRNLSKAVLSE